MRAHTSARAIVLASCALLWASCNSDPGPEAKPGSYLDTLRVLGVQAEPPEIAPGQQTFLNALVYDPKLYPEQMIYIWVYCEPSRDSALGTKCADVDTIRNPSSFLGGLLGQGDPSIQVRLFDHARSKYTASANLLAGMTADQKRRGVNVDVIMLAFESTDLTEVLFDVNSGDPKIPMVITLKTLHVAEGTEDTNRNPKIEALRVQGVETEAETTVRYPGLKRIELSALPSGDSLQKFTRYLPDGTVLVQDEELSVSWFTTAGSFEEGFATAARTSGANPIHLLLDPTNVKESATEVYAVLRDGRGGTDWAVRTIKVSP